MHVTYWRDLFTGTCLRAAVHGREHFADHDDRRGADKDHANAREDEEDEREDELHGRLCRFLFRDLPAAGPHGIALDAESLGDRGTELIGLDQDRRERLQIIDAATDAELLQHLLLAATHLELQIAEAKFGRNRPVRLFHFF